MVCGGLYGNLKGMSTVNYIHFFFFFLNMNIKVLIRRNAIIINCSINFENVVIAFSMYNL